MTFVWVARSTFPTDDEVYVFDDEDNARAFAATRLDDWLVTEEPILGDDFLREETATSAEDGRVRFLDDDLGGLWRRGDVAVDMGWESTPDVPVRLLRLERDGQVLSLTYPYERGLIERVKEDEDEDRGTDG